MRHGERSRAVHGGVVLDEGLPRPGTGRFRAPKCRRVGENRAQLIESQFLLSGLQRNSQQFRGIERFEQEAGRAVADAVHCRLKTAIGRDHDDFDLRMRAFDVMQEV